MNFQIAEQVKTKGITSPVQYGTVNRVFEPLEFASLKGMQLADFDVWNEVFPGWWHNKVVCVKLVLPDYCIFPEVLERLLAEGHSVKKSTYISYVEYEIERCNFLEEIEQASQKGVPISHD